MSADGLPPTERPDTDRLRRVGSGTDGDGIPLLTPGERVVLTSAANELDHLRRWKAEATAVLGEWDKVHKALGKPGRLGQSTAAASLAEAQRLTAENAAWMNGVADAVEPLGFDRHAANGPADLLPGLKMLAAQSNPVPFPGHVRPTTDPPAVPLVADPALTYPTHGLNGPAK